MGRVLAIIAVVLLIAGAGAGYVQWSRQTAVSVTRPSRGAAVQAVYATGTVEPETWARVGPVVAGRIAELLTAEGREVKQGQPLVRLDDREARAMLAEVEARLHYWESEVGRQKTLAERGHASRDALEKAQSESRQTQFAATAARKRLSDTVLTAPIDGVVLRRDGEIGETVDKNQVLLWVGRERPLRITADVDEEDIPRVQPGQRVLIKADAFPGQVLEGRVASVTPKGDPLTKSFRVRIALPGDTPVLIGMTTEINIVTNEVADALLVPASAVVEGRVWVVEAGLAHSRPIDTGIRGRDRIQVTGGLTSDESILANPPTGLTEGRPVRVIMRD
ncbi:MAG: efflux RND transporter periplasmic adaptor subunit [Alphaproteobacteria bacterium]